MFDSIEFTFGYNTNYKKTKKDSDFCTGRCSLCSFYKTEEEVCKKYEMKSKPDQKCRAFKEKTK